MTQPAAGGFGRKLREARERRGTALREIADTTKISVRALEALERNDISRLPGGIFSRGFVRAYAVAVGLEPEALIREFMAQFPHDSVTAGHPTLAPVDDSVAIESDRRTASTFLRMMLISVPIAGVLMYFGTADRRAATVNPLPPPAALEETAPSGVPPIATPEPSDVEASRTLAPEPAAIARLAVVLSATAPCWVSAVVDGQRIFDRQFDAGERQVLDVARDLVLTADDASALAMTLNGGRARPLGKAGQVVTAHLTLANYREYLAAP